MFTVLLYKLVQYCCLTKKDMSVNYISQITLNVGKVHESKPRQSKRYDQCEVQQLHVYYYIVFLCYHRSKIISTLRHQPWQSSHGWHILPQSTVTRDYTANFMRFRWICGQDVDEFKRDKLCAIDLIFNGKSESLWNRFSSALNIQFTPLLWIIHQPEWWWNPSNNVGITSPS